MIGAHPVMRRLFEAIEAAAPLEGTVLIEGPTGSGKELVAERLHSRSGRSGPLVAINVAALADSLAEAELFGTERGAYTGATNRRGLIEEAAGGTLYLDEACELTSPLQAKLLRVLETGRVRRLGKAAERPVTFRLVLSVQQPPAALVESGRWRSDFYYRVTKIGLRVPSLVERISDVPLLADHFLRELERTPLSPEAVAILLAHDWPGNVRELRGAIERAAFLSRGGDIDVEHVCEALTAFAARRPDSRRHGTTRHRTLREVEREHIVAVLADMDGDANAAARILGLSLRALYRRLRTLGVPTPRHRRGARVDEFVKAETP